MTPPADMPPADPSYPVSPGAQMVHLVVRLAMAVRYRKNVMLGALAAAAVLGGFYYATATRYYGAKAAMLVTQIGRDPTDTAIADDELVRRNTMPTFENMFRSPKVVEGALKNLAEEDRIDLAGIPPNRWVQTLQDNLSARTVRNTNILEVGYRSRDARAAVNVLQAVVQSYLAFMDQVHKGTTGDLVAVMVRERSEVAEKLGRVQEALLEARRKCGDMGFRSDSRVLHPVVQRAVFFNDTLAAIERQRVELGVALAGIEEAVREGTDLGQHVVAMGNLLGKELLMSLMGIGTRDALAEARLAELCVRDQADLAMMRQHFGPNHPEVVFLAEKIRLTESYLNGFRERVNQRIAELGRDEVAGWIVQAGRRKLDELRQQEEMFRSQYEEAQAAAVGLSQELAQVEILEHELERLSALDDTLLNQITTLRLRQNGQEVRTALAQEPVVDDNPVSPKLAYVALAVLAGGCVAGLAAVQFFEVLDDRFRSIDELQERLGVPVLAMIQRFDPSEATGLEALPMARQPAAPENESFRTLRTALALTHPEARQLAVTSAEPGDGKTTVLANLAVGFAQSGRKTLLIDADLRRPGLTRLMNLRGPRGLSEVLRAAGDMAGVASAHIQASGVPGLDVLPSGPRPPNPAELLAGPQLAQLLAWASSVYDQVLVDSPPVLAASDAALIGRLVDGVVAVVQPAKNRRGLVLRVAETLALLRIPLLGVVVNRAATGGDDGYYGYRGYDYGYGYAYGDRDEEELPDAKGPDEQHEALPFAAGSASEDAIRRVAPRRVA
ncbi:MAG: polysaccharide biosynthesis tyrosine autokinase [Thermoguttaceae bacterium]|jgi:capsular exopolysaccharide synthesis family protein|nr:polysaccharide biosynthesis tyrosine autokinase [Thermoguttaceae bacterium]